MPNVQWFEGQRVRFQYDRTSPAVFGRVFEVYQGRLLLIVWDDGELEALSWRSVCRFLHPDFEQLPGVV